MGREDGRPWMRLAISAGVGIVSVIVISWLLKSGDLSGTLKLLLAAIPVSAFAVCVISYRDLIRTLDEMQRQVHLEALAFAYPSTAVVVLAFEYLRKTGTLDRFKPDYILLAMSVLWLLGYLLARRRYQ